jgi:endoglucanase
MTLALAGVLLCALVVMPRPLSAASAPPLSIAVVGNHFVNGAGRFIRLLGVNREGTEYACVQKTGYSVGPEDASDAAAIASWSTNAVRIPLNEDCWLGINGLPAYGTAEGYRQMIESYVSALNAHGIYAVLDLQWTAPGTLPATGLHTMPDDNSTAFWTSVARTFANNPAVLFDAFNEPHSVPWSCWRDGGCSVPDAVDGTQPDPTQKYTAVGMQTLIDTIRATGARQPILIAGLNHGNDVSGWLANMPTDPDGQLAAAFHVYQPNSCASTACFDSTVAPVAAVVPVTTLEFSEQDCSENWDNALMNWDDAHDVGYLGWGWFILTPHCQSLYLITSWTGTPASPNGSALHDHLAALAASGVGIGVLGGGPAATGGPGGALGAPGGGSASPGAPAGAGSGSDVLAPSSDSASSGHGGAVTPPPRVQWIWLTGDTLSIRLRVGSRVLGRLSAATLRPFRVATGTPTDSMRISLGSRRFTLPGRRWRVFAFTLRAQARRLLASHPAVRARVTVSVAAPARRAVTLRRVIAARR